MGDILAKVDAELEGVTVHRLETALNLHGEIMRGAADHNIVPHVLERLNGRHGIVPACCGYQGNIIARGLVVVVVATVEHFCRSGGAVAFVRKVVPRFYHLDPGNLKVPAFGVLNNDVGIHSLLAELYPTQLYCMRRFKGRRNKSEE
ncbi:MAG: hypothetical protein BWX80_03953 [Candidatus Hydrogenedentes bacterium ADurb.Bin101]|nr:MAG: hypothetical protein BWX80_03953 [Candidatus Hydrogenedentes bacterium ADurb.Bin101]